MKGLASTFADPADVAAFRRCKATGKSDLECFKVGDNGIGFWGADTAATDIPMCAIRKSWLESAFGSLAAGRGRRIVVRHRGSEVEVIVADVMGEKVRASIDLNPAACRALGIRPPALVPVEFFLA